MPKFGVSTGEFPHQEPCRRPLPDNSSAMGDSGGDLSRRDSLRALFSLNVVVVIWGSQHAVIKGLLSSCRPSTINALRFSVATALIAPSLPRGADTAWTDGLTLGGLMFAGFALQAHGLQFTDSSRSAFLLYLNVKLVPLFACIFQGHHISTRTCASLFRPPSLSSLA